MTQPDTEKPKKARPPFFDMAFCYLLIVLSIIGMYYLFPEICHRGAPEYTPIQLVILAIIGGVSGFLVLICSIIPLHRCILMLPILLSTLYTLIAFRAWDDQNSLLFCISTMSPIQSTPILFSPHRGASFSVIANTECFFSLLFAILLPPLLTWSIPLHWLGLAFMLTLAALVHLLRLFGVDIRLTAKRIPRTEREPAWYNGFSEVNNRKGKAGWDSMYE